jgi:hypothetical protein
MAGRWMPPKPDEVRHAVEVAIADLEIVEQEIESEESEGTYGRILRAEFWGIRAATRKRLAEVEFLYGGDWRRTLRAALRDYQKGMEQGVKVDHWILGQYVVLRYLLVESEHPEPSSDREPFEFSWEEAHRSVLGALHSHKPDAKMWAHSSMADLLMVAQGRSFRPPSRQEVHPDSVLQELKRMVAVVGDADECQALWPTFRQFWRWRFWWTDPDWATSARLGYEYLWSVVEPRLHLGDDPSMPMGKAET